MAKRLLTTVLLATLLAGSLSAQDDERPSNVHKGFWIGFGLGGGVNLSTGLDDESLWGGAGYLRLGGTPGQKILLGGEVIGWASEKGNDIVSRGNVHFVATFYPNPKSGFYLKGGIGAASIARQSNVGNTSTTTDKGGFGLGAGTGYELQIGRNLYLVPAVDFLAQFFSEEDDPVLGHIPGTNTLLLFTLGLLWH